MAVQFVDEASIYVKAGNGGNGCVAFISTKAAPKKKLPVGGKGGDGGSVIVVGSKNLSTLLDFRYQQHVEAQNGENGGANNRYGKDGADTILALPIGTVITSESGEQFEVIDDQSPFILAAGGRGGRGNNGLKNPHVEWDSKGEVCEGHWYQLELRLVADIGIIGFPNAGKSSLVRKISGAKPKVADYPFTTLNPTLGVVDIGPGKTLTVCDIPGLVEGAHLGVGLGNRFLRHVSRVSCLVQMVDMSDSGTAWANEDGEKIVAEVDKAYRIIRNELAAHDSQLAMRTYLVLVNKIDLIRDRGIVESCLRHFEKLGVEALAVSTTTGEGIEKAVAAMAKLVVDRKAQTE